MNKFYTTHQQYRSFWIDPICGVKLSETMAFLGPKMKKPNKSRLFGSQRGFVISNPPK